MLPLPLQLQRRLRVAALIHILPPPPPTTTLQPVALLTYLQVKPRRRWVNVSRHT